MKSRALSTDNIAIMPDEEISRRISSLSGFIERERRRGSRQPDLEIEHSYLAREAGIRVERREAHDAWLRSGGAYRNYVEEM
jgi:hypothetical protein